ncbi:c-type cytochrome [Brevibacillus formosus]|uniref:c-type cytochrome n=1 Tax=Brevibacillus formosus TaxID=54913 RepID=UPI001C669EB4|nr:cytochrome c [Brevibacillus formosus]MBW5470962.1 c-type cytochrome [Brevibacillus formosus]
MKAIKYLLIGSLFLVATACSNAATEEQTEAADTEKSVMKLYKNNCMSCHGNDLSGRVGPGLQQVGSKMTEENLVEIITVGANGMPGYEKVLSAEEIGQLAKWLSEKKE